MAKMDKLVRYRCVLYAIGIVLWFTFTILLPTVVGEPAAGPITPLTSTLGYLLLGANGISALLRRDEYGVYNKNAGGTFNVDRYDREGKRLDVVQNTGYYVILPASVAAAISAISAHGSRLLLAYLGASITTGVVALVPIWASTTDWRNTIILRHIKSLMLIWAMTWLVEGIVALLSANLPPA